MTVLQALLGFLANLAYLASLAAAVVVLEVLVGSVVVYVRGLLHRPADFRPLLERMREGER